MGSALALLFSVVAALISAAVALLAGVFIAPHLFHGDLAIAMTAIGGLATGVVVLVLAFKKLSGNEQPHQ
jgi:positive regulator of sigma E activity